MGRFISRRYPQVEVIQRPFIDAASRCNFGLAQVASPWVLSFAAECELSDEFILEFASLALPDSVVGTARGSSTGSTGGRWAGRCTRRAPSSIERRGVLPVGKAYAACRPQGDVLPLPAAIYHDDRKPQARWRAAVEKSGTS